MDEIRHALDEVVGQLIDSYSNNTQPSTRAEVDGVRACIETALKGLIENPSEILKNSQSWIRYSNSYKAYLLSRIVSKYGRKF